MTLSQQRTENLPAEGEIGVVDIGELTLESGAVIDDVSIAVQRWGELSPNRDNVVVVLHALTGDSHITGPAGPAAVAHSAAARRSCEKPLPCQISPKSKSAWLLKITTDTPRPGAMMLRAWMPPT